MRRLIPLYSSTAESERRISETFKLKSTTAVEQRLSPCSTVAGYKLWLWYCLRTCSEVINTGQSVDLQNKLKYFNGFRGSFAMLQDYDFKHFLKALSCLSRQKSRGGSFFEIWLGLPHSPACVGQVASISPKIKSHHLAVSLMNFRNLWMQFLAHTLNNLGKECLIFMWRSC